MSAPVRGDVVRVDWLDTCEDPVGNPDKASLFHRTSYGIFWEQKLDSGVEVLVTTTTLDKDSPEQQGYCIYPMGNVTALKVVAKKRRQKAARKEASNGQVIGN